MNNMIWLIRREVWENRSLWIAPLVVAGVILIISAFGYFEDKSSPPQHTAAFIVPSQSVRW